MKLKRAIFLGRLEIIAFGIGFCLLAYELVAARLLAPYIGSSIYVWTSVIGIIILALSFGYAFGGWLADKRIQALDVTFLLLIAAGGVSVTLLTYTTILESIVAGLADPRLQGFLASLVLFAPTSFVLGSISPYLARLKLKSIITTGRVVASLSAVNSLGGITGTFITGFILFGYFGSNQILALLVVMLVVLSWLIIPRRHMSERLIATAGLVVITAAGLKPELPRDVVAEIDTPSAHYRVQNISTAEDPFRVLITGPGGWQSGSFLNGSSELVFWYTKKIAEITEQAPKRDNILILGGGAFSLPRYFSEKYPDAAITVVEIDPVLSDIAQEYFFYKPKQNVTVIAEDARAFLEKNATVYDTIIVDAFGDTSVPYTLTTKEYSAALKKATSEHSQVIVNLIVSRDGPCGELFSGIDASYKEYFSYAAYFDQTKDNLRTRQNVIAVYASQPLSWLDRTGAIKTSPPLAQSFTDNFTPTDRLNFECKSS